MAFGMFTYDLPPVEKMEAYEEKARTLWTPAVLKQKGVKELRAFRDPCHMTPQVMTWTEFDTLESWLEWASSEAYADLVSDMRSAGCTNFSSQVWETSPLIPEPLKPVGA